MPRNAMQWPAGTDQIPTTPLYSRPGVIQTSQPPTSDTASGQEADA